MMGKIKMMCTAVAALAIGSAFADAANVLVKFSTTGTDYYADGVTPVKAGEWYALCWSPTETFVGLKTTAEGTVEPAAEGQKVLILAPLAAEGYCPTTLFQVDSADVPIGGYYFVLLLDTRDASGTPSVALENGSPAKVNGTTVALDAKSSSEKSGISIAATGNTTTTEYAVVKSADFKPASVSITMAGSKAVVSILNANPAIRYNVMYGSTVGAIDTKYLDDPVTGAPDGQQINITIDNENAKFFKLIQD